MQNRNTNKFTLRAFLRSYWPHIVLFLLVCILFVTNYTPGTWLTGWDNLHPELFFRENIVNRSIFSTWQSYQGLGVRAGNAHAADLLRQLFLAALSLTIPTSLLRYVYHFLALFIGSVGIYELITRRLLRSRDRTAQITGFCGAVFAVLNLGTMQNFYVPYEAFSHAFASFPWLLLALFGYLDNPSKHTFVILIVINVLATPMFYIPTLFLVYGAILAIILAAHLIKTKQWKITATTLAVVGLVNAFWLLPFAAFVIHGTSFVSEVKINRLFTQEAFLRNQKYGTIADVPILRGFLFDTTDMVDTKTGRNDFMMKPWIAHLDTPLVYWSLIGLFAIILIGLISAVIRRKPHAKTVSAIFLFSIFAFLNDNPPTGWLFQLFQKNLPLFGQVFRLPYTKFIVPAICSYACGLAYAIYFVCQTRRNLLSKHIAYVIPAGLLAILIALNWPAFQGNFIYRYMRQNVPSEYQQLYTFFRTQPSDGKIANLPQPTFWGWTTYDWGYRGSGFPWYGMAQPILDRAFDVWNLDNEQYYADLTQALYTQQTPEAIESVFDHYHISYLWLDEHVVLPYKSGLLFYDKLKTILTASKRFSKVFEQGKQTVYRLDKDKQIQPVTVYSTSTQTYHPFRLNQPPNVLNIQNDKNGITLTTQIQNGALSIPNNTVGPWPILGTIRLQTDKTAILSLLLPKIVNNGKEIPFTPSAIATISSQATGGFLQVNDQLVDKTIQTPILLYPTKNIIAAYPSSPTISANISSVLFKQPLHNCLATQPTVTTFFGRNISLSNTLSLFGSNSHPCVYGKFSDLISKIPAAVQTGIIEIQLEYKATSNEHPTVCLTRNGETGCFFETHGSQTGKIAADGWTTVTAAVPVRDYPLQNIWLKLELAADTVTQQQIQYRNITLNLYTTPVERQQFNVSAIQSPAFSVPVSAGNLSLEFPATQFTGITISPDDIPKIKQNCFTLGDGSFNKTIQEDKNVGPYVRYQANNASSCDSFPFEEQSLKAGGIALFTTRDINGRPLKTCINIDPPGYCLTEDFLPVQTHNWSTVALPVPPVGQTVDATYYMELDNYAVGQETRINDLSAITLTPIPYPWVTALTMTSAGAADADKNTVGTLKIPYSNPTLYVVSSIQNSSDKQQLLVLSQSFDSGWLAVTPSKTFPFLTPAGKHVLVNNWGNGWMLEQQAVSSSQLTVRSDTKKPSTTNGEPITIYIFFWPQLLEFFGFVLLPIPFLAVWLKRVHA